MRIQAAWQANLTQLQSRQPRQTVQYLVEGEFEVIAAGEARAQLGRQSACQGNCFGAHAGNVELLEVRAQRAELLDRQGGSLATKICEVDVLHICRIISMSLCAKACEAAGSCF